MVFLDKYGWPVEVPKNHFFKKWLRRLFLTRRIRKGKWQEIMSKPVLNENCTCYACSSEKKYCGKLEE